jgi:hypothetical protein
MCGRAGSPPRQRRVTIHRYFSKPPDVADDWRSRSMALCHPAFEEVSRSYGAIKEATAEAQRRSSGRSGRSRRRGWDGRRRAARVQLASRMTVDSIVYETVRRSTWRPPSSYTCSKRSPSTSLDVSRVPRVRRRQKDQLYCILRFLGRLTGIKCKDRPKSEQYCFGTWSSSDCSAFCRLRVLRISDGRRVLATLSEDLWFAGSIDWYRGLEDGDHFLHERVDLLEKPVQQRSRWPDD